MGVHASASLAQETELEQVVVTGSRIPQANLEGTSPVTVLGSQDVQFEGTVQVEDLINNLPQAFADQGGNISNGASGTATVNLRNLGADRTLVLVNSRRLPAGSPRGPVAPDLNQIPSSMIERVEVLTGGASAVYGSDAVAGVVNFILKDNFEGVQIDADYSGYWHKND
ncbi:MAG: TonB-dependent receptor plug domain-containing protein, partial [Gammaproteobacteria bacterium]|nr:TonB-dependent receptor plug domain-containing protein [Gammaproteobacteria bacterium]